MSVTPPTQELFLPSAPMSRRKRTPIVFTLAVLVVIIAGLLAVMLHQVQTVPVAAAASVERATVVVVDATTAVESAPPVQQIQQVTSTTATQSTTAMPSTTTPVEPDATPSTITPVEPGATPSPTAPVEPGAMSSPTAMPSPTAPVEPGAVEPAPIPTVDTPSGDLTDAEEDSLEAGPQAEVVLAGDPAPPAEVADPAPVEPFVPLALHVTGVQAAVASDQAAGNQISARPVAGLQLGVATAGQSDLLVSPGPVGCSVQCITKAVISFGADPTTLALDAKTTTPAHIAVLVSTTPPIFSGGVPTLVVIDASSATNGFVTSWDGTVPGLTPATEYHIVVRATDENGNTAHQVGKFTSPAAPAATVDLVIVPLKLTVTNDGDKNGAGELRFAWQVGDSVDSRAEQRMDDGESFLFPFYGQTYFNDVAADALLPSVLVTAFERDPDGKVEFNPYGDSGPISSPDHGHIDPTDEKYNSARTGIGSVESLEYAPRCSSFGIIGAWANYPCAQVSTIGYGNDYPEFQAIIAYQVASDIPNPNG